MPQMYNLKRFKLHNTWTVQLDPKYVCHDARLQTGLELVLDPFHQTESPVTLSSGHRYGEQHNAGAGS